MMLENILADFELLDDWEDRYRYVIELGRSLPPLPEAARAEANKMRGRRPGRRAWRSRAAYGLSIGSRGLMYATECRLAGHSLREHEGRG